MDYVYKTKPYRHQEEAFALSRDAEAFALFMEMGTGKSKVIVDTAAYLYSRGRMGGLVVVAPNGVHRNWTRPPDHRRPGQVAVHLPDWCPRIVAPWSSSPRKAEAEALEALMFERGDMLRVLALNVEAFRVPRAREYVKKFVRLYSPMFVVDESTRIKSSGAKQTKTIINLARAAPYRRILSGQPTPEDSPLELYSQFKFLDPDILGHTTVASFKARYAELLDQYHPLVQHALKKVKSARKPLIQIVARDDDGRPIYKNRRELAENMAPHCFRVRKVDCLDLPEEIYEDAEVTMTPDAKRMYNEILSDGVAFMEDQTSLHGATPEEKLWKVLTGEVQVPHVVAKMGAEVHLRLMQILGGWPTPEGTDMGRRRVNQLIEIAETSEKMVVWAWFRPELAAIAKAFREEFGERSTVEYHGGVGNTLREEAEAEFQAGDARFFVGQPASGGIGIDLFAASEAVYYSHGSSGEARTQSESRLHRLGQERAVTYMDMFVPDTLEEKVVLRNRDKRAGGEQFMDMVQSL